MGTKEELIERLNSSLANIRNRSFNLEKEAEEIDPEWKGRAQGLERRIEDCKRRTSEVDSRDTTRLEKAEEEVKALEDQTHELLESNGGNS